MKHEANKLEQDQLKAIRKTRANLEIQLDNQKTRDRAQLKQLQQKMERIQDEASEISDIQSDDEMVNWELFSLVFLLEWKH